MHNELPSYDQAPAGAIRFNTDSNKLEVYIGGPVGYGTLPNGQWMQVDNWSPENQTGGTRGLVGGGYDSANRNDINYITIDTTGNAIDFGDLTESRRDLGAVASRTRGVFGLGFAAANSDTLDYVTIASTGNAVDFGNATVARRGRNSGTGNATRGIFNDDDNTVLDYITIASTGDAVDFGDLTQARYEHAPMGNAHGGLG